MPRILVVDDAVVDLRLAGRLLEKQPEWAVIYARDGAEALEQIESHLPDLVVTDLQMPNMDGLQLVETIRDEYPMIPTVLMTATGSEQIAVSALQKGAASYVPKGELAADLVDTVTRILSIAEDERGRRRLQHYLSEVAFVLENDLALLSALVQHLRQTLEDRWMFDKSQCLRFAMAVDEALQNAYFHGNLEVGSEIREQDAQAYRDLADERRRVAPYCDRKIRVRAQLNRQQATIAILDEGPGFDPAALPDPTTPGFVERPCGRGVLLMRSFCDEVRFNERGNEVLLIKRATPPPDSHVLASEE